MEVTKSTIAILAAACITAGAGASYLVTRADAPAAAAQPTLEATLALEPGGVVDASEGLVPDVPAEVPVEPAIATPPESFSRPRPAAPAARPVVPAAVPVEAEPPPPPPAAVVPAPATASFDVAPPLPLEPVRAAEEPALPTAPPAPDLHELVLSGDSVIGLQVESAISSETAEVEDQVVARVVRDVKVGDHVAIPAGSKARGEVTQVERGGRLRGRARLGVRFTSIVLADGSTVPITTETIYREGDAQGRESTAKIGGGAIGGAIIGGILGGAKGAAIGGGIGAGAGSAAVMAGGRNEATLSPGSPVTIRLQAPATVTVAR